MDIMQQLYESGINCTISSFWDDGFDWKLGDAMNGFVAEGHAESFGDAEESLAKAAREHYPTSDFRHCVAKAMRAIEKTIEAVRGIDRWGASEMLERAVQAFEALPPPRSCWDILGVSRGASREAIDAAYRDKACRAHPDAGGSNAAMAELNRARDEALRAN